MNKEIININTCQCPLSEVAELGEKAKSAWIFLHKSARKIIKRTCDSQKRCPAYTELFWHEAERYPKTLIRFENTESEWARVYYIEAEDIDFRFEPEDPEYIVFIKMVD